MKKVVKALLACLFLTVVFSSCGGINDAVEKEYIRNCETERTFILSSYEGYSELESYDFYENKSLGLFTSTEKIKKVIPSGNCVCILYDDYFLRTGSLFKSPEKVSYPEGASPELIDFAPLYDSYLEKWCDHELYYLPNDNAVYCDGEKVIELGEETIVEDIYYFRALKSKGALLFYEKDKTSQCGHYDLESGEVICSFSMKNREILSFLRDCVIIYDRGTGEVLIYDSDCAGKEPSVIWKDFNLEKDSVTVSSDARFIFTVEEQDDGKTHAVLYDRATGLITTSETLFSEDGSGLSCVFISNSGEYGFVQNKKGEYVKVLFDRGGSAAEELIRSTFILPEDFSSFENAVGYEEYFSEERELRELSLSKSFDLLLKDYEYFIYDYSEKDGPLKYYVPDGYVHPIGERNRLYVRKRGNGLCKMLIDEPCGGYVPIGDKIYFITWNFDKIYCIDLFGGNVKLLNQTELYGMGSFFYYDEVCFFSDNGSVCRLHYGSGIVDRLLELENKAFYPVTNMSVMYFDSDSGKCFIYSEADKTTKEIAEEKCEELMATVK